MNKSLALTTFAAAAALVLTGCTPGSGGTPPSGGPEPAPTVTITATPAPVAVPDYGFTFFHEATLGSNWNELGAQLHMPVGPYDPACPWYGPVWSTQIATTTAYMSNEDPSAGTNMFYTNYLLATSGDNFPRNAEGVGVGSTRAEVLAAYPSAVVDTYNDLGAGDMTRITVEDPDSDSKYVFAIAGNAGADTVDLLQWGPIAGSQWSHLCQGF